MFSTNASAVFKLKYKQEQLDETPRVRFTLSKYWFLLGGEGETEKRKTQEEANQSEVIALFICPLHYVAIVRRSSLTSPLTPAALAFQWTCAKSLPVTPRKTSPLIKQLYIVMETLIAVRFIAAGELPSHNAHVMPTYSCNCDLVWIIHAPLLRGC